MKKEGRFNFTNSKKTVRLQEKENSEVVNFIFPTLFFSTQYTMKCQDMSANGSSFLFITLFCSPKIFAR